MECKLSKLWIAGLNYEGCNISMGSKKYDYTIEYDNEVGVPGNILYSLKNGGGKGVFLQCLFQPLDPLCGWKNNKNKVVHFFYNDYNEPVNYTFYVVEEWYISKTKRLMCGIGIAPQTNKNNLILTNKAIELKYILFSKVYEDNDNFDIFSLPLWDEEKNKAKPLQQWELWLSNQNDLQYYNQYNKSEYIQLLDEYGLDQHTIKMIEKLNVEEHNISSYFKKSTDNIGIFSERIIPTINNKIENIDEDDNGKVSTIIVTFMETLKISKELPKYLNTIKNIEELNEFTIPLKGDYIEIELYIKEEKILCDTCLEANRILKNIKNSKKNSIDKLKEEKIDLENEIDRLDWQKDNIRYIEALNEKNKLKEEYESLNDILLKFEDELEIHKDKLKLKTVNKFLKEYQELLEEIEALKANIERLESDYSILEIREKIQVLSIKIKENWNKIYDDWSKKFTINHNAKIEFEKNKNEINRKIQEEDRNNRKIEYDIKSIEDENKQFKNSEKRIIDEFGETIIVYLEKIIFETENILIDLKDRVNEKEKEEIETNIIIKNISFNCGQLSIKVNQYKESIEERKKDLEKQIKKEDKLLNRASMILKEHLEPLYSKNDYSMLEEKIRSVLESKKVKIKRYYKKYVECKNDMELVKEGKNDNIYIANSDLIRIKKMLDENKINNMYGTKYLKQFDSSELQYQLNKNSALPYSIVVLEEDIENINMDFLENELLKSLVIIVDSFNVNKIDSNKINNPSIKKISQAIFIPNNKSYDYINDSYNLKLRNDSIERNLDDLYISIEEEEKVVDSIEEFLKDIDITKNNMLSRDIKKLIEQYELNLKNFDSELDLCEKEICENEKYIENIINEKSNLKKEIEFQSDKLEQLRKFKGQKDRYEENILKIRLLKEEFEKSKNSIDSYKLSLTKKQSEYNRGQQQFEQLVKNIDKDYSRIKELIGDIKYPEPDLKNLDLKHGDINHGNYRQSLSKDIHNTLLEYDNYKNIENNKNFELARCNYELQQKNINLVSIEKRLQRLGTVDYDKKESVQESVEMLDNSIKILENEVNELDKKIQGIKVKIENTESNIAENQNKINRLEIELTDDYPEYGFEYIALNDLEDERRKIKIEKTNKYDNMEKIEGDIKSIHKNVEELERSLDILFGINNGSIDEKISILTEEEIKYLSNSPIKFCEEWNALIKEKRRQIFNKKSELEQKLYHVKSYINNQKNLNENFGRAIERLINVMQSRPYEECVLYIEKYQKWANDNLEKQQSFKKKADDAVNIWSDRVAKRIIEICMHIEELGSKMKIRNWNNTVFPIIKIEPYEAFPKNVEDINYEIKQLCINTISSIIDTGKDIDELVPKDIEKYINISTIMLKILIQYPKLKIYIPPLNEGNLLRGEPNNEYYKEWETINNGSSTSSTKSGGQTLLAQLIILTMLMRERADENRWLFLVSDNPFGTMSSQELIESVFTLLELLRIQWLVVSPPITDITITSKFNNVYQMEIMIKNNGRELTESLVKKNRKFLNGISILKHPN